MVACVKSPQKTTPFDSFPQKSLVCPTTASHALIHCVPFHAVVSIILHIGSLDKSTLDTWSAVGQLFTTIIFNSLAPNAHLSFGMKFGNPSLAGIGQVDSNATILVQQVHLKRCVIE